MKRPLLSLAGLGWLAAAQPLLLDPDFPTGSGPDSWVRSVAVRSDGRVLIAGNFTNVHGVYRPGLAQLLPDGRLDPSFVPTITQQVGRVRLAPDGAVLVSGWYTDANRTYPGVAKLRPDGTRDLAFTLPPPRPVNTSYDQLYPAGDGRLWLSGTFTEVGGVVMPRLARLNPDGTVDLTFRSPFIFAKDQVRELLPLPDGRVLVAGSFTNLGGVRGYGLARLEANGTVDPSFQSPLGPYESVSQLVLLEDGRLMARWSGGPDGKTQVRRLVRLLPDGPLDPTYPPTFAPGDVFFPGTLVTHAAPDGSALIYGTFFAVHGAPRPGLARLLPDGATDFCYDPGLGPSDAVLDAARAPDGSVYLAGMFTEVEGQARPFLARLRPPGPCAPGVIAFGHGDLRVSEDAGRVLLSVTRQGGADREARVDFETLEGTARAGADFVATRGTLVFPPGVRSVSLEVPVLAETAVEPEEQFTVRLRDVSPGATLGTPAEVTVTVVDVPPGGQAGRVDPAFRPALPWPVSVIVVEPGALWVAGGGWRLAGTTGGVVRLHLDGSPDPSFNPVACDEEVRALARLPDGRWLAGGDFSTVNGRALPGLMRLSATGEVDPDFAPLARMDGPFGGPLTARVNAIQPLADGSALLAGTFRLPEDYAPRALLRVLPDGRLDGAFAAGLGRGGARTLLPWPDGGWLAGMGGFNAGVLRVLADGTVEPRFVPPVNRLGSVNALALDSGSGVWVAGRITDSVTSSGQAALMRLNRDGSLAADLTAAVKLQGSTTSSPSLLALLALPDGKCLVGGRFSAVDRFPGRIVARLLPTGRVDLSFDAGPVRARLDGDPATAQIPAEVRVLAAAPEGGWFAGGDFAGMGEVNQPYLVRLLPESPGPQTVELVLDVTQLSESAGALTGRLVRQGDASAPASVWLQIVPLDNPPGEDFEQPGVRLDFAPGQWVYELAVPLLNNTWVASNRTYRLVLSEPSPGLTLIEPTVWYVRVLEDDVNVEFAASEFAAREDDGRAWLRVVRTGVAGPAVTVRCRAGGTEALTEFPALPRGGVRTNYVRWPVPDDAVAQGNRRVPVTLEIVGGGATLGPRAQAELVVIDNDFSLAPAPGVAGEVNALARAPEGGLYLAGDFTAVHGVERRNLARLRADFSVDPAFDPGAGPDGPVTALLVQEDGGVVLAGEFQAVAGRPRQRLARLRPDGALDETFDAGAGPVWAGTGLTNQPGRILALAPAADDGLWLGGQFTAFDQEPAVGLVRLRHDGRVDTGFRAPFQLKEAALSPPRARSGWTTVRALEVEPDGRVLVAGLMNVPVSPSKTAPQLFTRLLPDGTPDATFTPRLAGLNDAEFQTLARGPDGRWWAGSGFNLPGGHSFWVALWRIEPDGREDATFRIQGLPPMAVNQSLVRQILPLPDGSALVLVEFAVMGAAPDLRQSWIARVRADGGWEASFPTITAELPAWVRTELARLRDSLPAGDLRRTDFSALSPGAGAIRAMLAGDSMLVVGGAFSYIAGEPRRGLARFSLAGELWGRFALGARVTGAEVQLELPPDLPWPCVVEASPDLRQWTPLDQHVVPWQGWTARVPAAGPHQFFRARQAP